MPISIKIFKNSFWNLIQFMSQGVTGIFTSILIARYLGPEFMGEYSFFVWFIGIMVILGGIGFPNTLTKYISEFIGGGNETFAQAIYSRLIKIQLIMVFFLTLLLVSIVFLTLSPPNREYYFIASLALIPLCMNALLVSAFHGLQDFKIPSIVGSIINLIQLALVILFIFLDTGLRGLIAIPFISGIIQMFFLGTYINRTFSMTSSFEITKEYTRTIFNYTLRVYWIILLSMIVWQKSEVLFLKMYSTSEQIAFYSIAFNITTMMLGLTGLFSAVVFPVLSSYFGANFREGIQNIYSKSIKAIIIFYFPLCAVFIAIATPLVVLMYSSNFIGISIPLIILITSSLFASLGILFANVILAVGRTDIQARYVTLVAVINILLDFMLIPPFGATGAAIANTSVMIIGFAIWIRVIKKQLDFSFPIRETIICLLPNILLATILFLVGYFYANILGIILVFIITLVAYPFLLITFKTITSDDVRTVKEIATILPAPYEKMIGTVLDKLPVRQAIF